MPIQPNAPEGVSVLTDGPWTHRTVRANGIALHIAEAGTGPLVLLLHGFPTHWWTWHRQLTDLADAGFRAVAVDLRGYGASDKPPRGYDSRTLASDVTQLITALGERQAMLVGNDIGGALAWTAATLQPRLVSRIAVLGAAHPRLMRRAIARDATQRRASAYGWRTFQIPRRPEALLTRHPDYVRGLFDGWTGPKWRGTPDYVASVERYQRALKIHPVAFCAAEHYRWLLRSTVRSDGRRYQQAMRRPVDVPVLQLHGDLDTCVLPRTAQGSGQFVAADYEWRLLDGVGHFPQHEAPELVSSELIRWAKG